MRSSLYASLLWFEESKGKFHIPEIPEDERIRVYTPKIRKHATKRRGNKLHDKKRKGRR
jgi:hypothetical protein